MKLNDYLKENSDIKTRSKEITEEEFFTNLKEKCRDALSVIPIWRGTRSRFEYGFMSPGKRPRKSKNTRNWYTVHVNDSESWSKYPNRSLICSTGKDGAEGYGNVYRIFPVDGAKIGVCSKRDFWFSFKDISYPPSWVTSMDTFNDIIEKAMFLANPNKKLYDDSLGHMKYYMKAIGPWFSERLETFKAIKKFEEDHSEVIYKIIDYFHNHMKFDGGDFYKAYTELLDPEKNGFKLYTIENLPSGLHASEQEVWLDADVYLCRDTPEVNKKLFAFMEEEVTGKKYLT
jgi:hypothetical protein